MMLAARYDMVKQEVYTAKKISY